MCLVILSNRYSQDLVIKWERRKDVEKLRKELKRKSFENLSLIFVCRNAASHLADEWTARSLYFSFYFFLGGKMFWVACCCVRFMEGLVQFISPCKHCSVCILRHLRFFYCQVPNGRALD